MRTQTEWPPGTRSSSGAKGAAEGDAEAEGVEPGAGDELGVDALAAVVVGEGERRGEAGGDGVEAGGVVAEVAEHRVGEAILAHDEAGVGSGRGEVRRLGGVADGERAEQDLVGDGEDGGVGADAERERDQRDDREERRAAEDCERRSGSPEASLPPSYRDGASLAAIA